MDTNTILFFEQQPEALALYEVFEKEVVNRYPDSKIKVQKTQISFYNRHLFACVSFAKVRKAKDCPDTYIVVTVGLSRRLGSSRVDIATEPYPNRWTHHILIADPEEIDDELLGWLKEAADFSAAKR